MSRRHIRWCAATLFAALSLTAACRPAAEPELHGLRYRVVRPAPPIVLTEYGGRRFDLSKERGHVVLLYFGYTHCPDLCPLTLQRWSRARALLGADADRTRFVFVSVDAARDSAAITQAYARQFDSTFIGLSAPADTAARLARDYGVLTQSQSDAAGNVVVASHAEQTFLVDPRGRLLLTYAVNAFTPQDMAADIRALLAHH